MQTHLHGHTTDGLVATAVGWTILPSLINLCAIKHFLAQPLIHLIMTLTEPLAQPLPTAYVWWMLLYFVAKVRRAVCAWIQGG